MSGWIIAGKSKHNMKSSEIIWHAFGDESAFEHVVTYGIVGVRPELQHKSELRLMDS